MAIISYLNAIRPSPSDEQYLPSFCDVVQLLQALLDLEEEGVCREVRGVARAMLDSDVFARDVQAVKDTLQKLEVFIQQQPPLKDGINEGGREPEGH